MLRPQNEKRLVGIVNKCLPFETINFIEKRVLFLSWLQCYLSDASKEVGRLYIRT